VAVIAAGVCAATAGIGAAHGSTAPSASAARTVTVTISGGHATKAVDNGRPVVLVAGALGVPPKVFRHAFSLVTPAPAGTEPDPAQVDRNKAALLGVLGPYGVSNDQLDRASNHYRYDRGAGGSWPRTAALLKATVAGGRIVRLTIVRGGSGYSSMPALTVPGVAGVRIRATLAFSRQFAANGRISALSIRR
jgi:hypothetical protein